MKLHHWAALALSAALAGCGAPSEHGAGSGAAFQGEAAKAGSFLAYEHQVGIRLASERIDAQLAASRDACTQDRFGPCELIAIEQSGDSQRRNAQLVVRIVPDGVEKLVALAAAGGQLQRRSTRAEDLAQAVSDTQQLRDRLEREYQTLQGFQGRKDMSVSDLLALDFSSDHQPTGRWSRIGEAFGHSLDELTDGTVNAIQVAAFGLPLLVVLLIAALILRWLWRKLGTRRAAN